MKLKFLAEHFKRCALPGRSDLRQFIADEANARLNEMLSAAPTITVSGTELAVRFDALPEKFKARLVSIEPLEK